MTVVKPALLFTQMSALFSYWMYVTQKPTHINLRVTKRDTYTKGFPWKTREIGVGAMLSVAAHIMKHLLRTKTQSTLRRMHRSGGGGGGPWNRSKLKSHAKGKSCYEIINESLVTFDAPFNLRRAALYRAMCLCTFLDTNHLFLGGNAKLNAGEICFMRTDAQTP